MYLRHIWIVVLTLLWSTAAAAQEGQPFPAQAIPVWRTVMSGGGTSDHGSPVAACEAQRASFNPNAIAQPPTEGDWKAWNCHWLGKQDGIDDANTHLPAIVTLECPGGYTLTAPGLCLRYDEARAPATACDCGPGQSSPPRCAGSSTIPMAG